MATNALDFERATQYEVVKEYVRLAYWSVLISFLLCVACAYLKFSVKLTKGSLAAEDVVKIARDNKNNKLDRFLSLYNLLFLFNFLLIS